MVQFLFGFFAELFNFLISFLLVFALTYGVLSKTEVVSDRASVNSLLAFAMGLIFAFSGAFKFIVAVVPYFAILIVLFASMFIVLFFLGFKLESLLKSKFVVWTIIIVSAVFVLFTGWNMYYEDVKQQLAIYTLENTTINESQLSANYTGNPFHDIPLRYEYHCMANGRYLAPILFFGQGGVLCLVMHPRVIGVVLLLPLLALIVLLLSRMDMPKEEKK